MLNFTLKCQFDRDWEPLGSCKRVVGQGVAASPRPPRAIDRKRSEKENRRAEWEGEREGGRDNERRKEGWRVKGKGEITRGSCRNEQGISSVYCSPAKQLYTQACIYVHMSPPPPLSQSSKSISTPLSCSKMQGEGGKNKTKDVSKFSNESIRKFWSERSRKEVFVVWMRNEIYRDEHSRRRRSYYVRERYTYLWQWQAKEEVRNRLEGRREGK